MDAAVGPGTRGLPFNTNMSQSQSQASQLNVGGKSGLEENGRSVVGGGGGSAAALGSLATDSDLDSAIELQMQMQQIQQIQMDFFHNPELPLAAVVVDPVPNHGNDHGEFNAMNVGDLSALFAATNTRNDSGTRAGLQPQQHHQQQQQQHQQQQQQHGQAMNTGPPGTLRESSGNINDGLGHGHGHGQPGLMRSTAATTAADTMNMEALQQLLALSAQAPTMLAAPPPPPGGPFGGGGGLRADNIPGMSGTSTPGGNATAAALLEQQIRLSQLQQLQQLQQQIFQQQVCFECTLVIFFFFFLVLAVTDSETFYFFLYLFYFSSD